MIKVGLVGYGFMGKMHSQCYQATGDAKVVALADVEADRREEAKAKLGCETYSSIEDMLASADIDIVDICTPTYLHEEHVATAAKAGKDIFCEKPMSLSVESCDRMIKAAEDAGVKLMIGQVIRFWPEYQVMKEIIDSGKYGKVEWASARRLSPFAAHGWQNWFADPARSGGAILDLHIHDVDYFLYLFGTPKVVSALGVTGRGGGIDNVQSLSSGYESGVKCYAEASLDLSPTYPFTMALLVVLENATIRYDSGVTPSLTVYPAEGDAFAPKVEEPGVGSSSEQVGNISSLGGYFNEIKYYVDCVKAGKKPEVVTPRDAREAVIVCLAERKSIETGQPVEL